MKINPALLIVVIGFCIVRACLFDAIPRWDSGWYWSCLQESIQAGLKPSSLNWVGHIAVGFSLPVTLVQLLKPDSLTLLHITLSLYSILAVIGFYLILKELLGKNTEIECALGASLFALHPVFLANSAYLSLDFPVLVYSIWSTLFFLRRKILLAACAGFLLSFSKEVGAAFFLLQLIVYVLFTYSWKTQFKATILAFLPSALYGARIILRLLFKPEASPIYTETALQRLSPIQFALDINFFDPALRTFLADLFVLNWQWLFVMILIFALIAAAFSRRKIFNINLVFVFICWIFALYLVTRVRPFNHTRYLLLAYPWLSLCTATCVIQTFKTALTRYLILGCLLIFTGIANLSSIDPLSRAYYGTFQAGQSEMYNMGQGFFSANDTHEKFNKDELVYNLQLFLFQDLEDRAFADMNLQTEHLIIGSEGSKLFWPWYFNTHIRRQSLSSENTIKLNYVDRIEDLESSKLQKSQVWYLELPYAKSLKQERDLLERYQVLEIRTYIKGGVSLRTFLMEQTK